MAEHNELGRAGEELAANFLASKGYKILEKNWRAGQYEIDIIAQYKNILIIAEVKTVKSKAVKEPEISVGRVKQRNLINAANIYMNFKKMDMEARFDIITILATTGVPVINHIEDAFYPTIRR